MLLGECAALAAWIVFNNTFFPFYIYIISGVFFFLTELFNILAFLTEPGIIPRNHPDFIKKENNNKEEMKIQIDVNKNDNIDILSQNSNNNINRKISENISKNNLNDQNLNINELNKNNFISNSNDNNTEIKPNIFTKRECSTCHIIRPPGASHCSTCDNCVLNFDNKTVKQYYTLTGIGRKNYF